MNKDFCCCPSCGSCNAHINEPKLKDKIKKQASEIAELEESRLALIKKIDSLTAHETCACSYDKEDDICLHHSPKLVEKDKEIAALRGFIESARENSEIYPFFDSQDFKELLEKHKLY